MNWFHQSVLVLADLRYGIGHRGHGRVADAHDTPPTPDNVLTKHRRYAMAVTIGGMNHGSEDHSI
ncbi:hypothetical protein SPHV1_780001 [Novosphingobium sp. KN65.2]|nr:hypothetical protein SPHV1_780001 [Novosphingobium sp. KN65.2]